MFVKIREIEFNNFYTVNCFHEIFFEVIKKMCFASNVVNFFVKSIFGVIENEGVTFTEFWFGSLKFCIIY